MSSESSLMRATATPLASIFGSGFLVIVPILAGAAGPYAVVAMAAVCALAYAVGTVIRFNIRHAEPAIDAGTAPVAAVRRERAADLALVIAYAISVCLYVRILAAFLLGGLGVDTPAGEHFVTVVVVGAIGLVGYTRGLEMLQKLELWALGLTLVIIVALLTGFGLYDLGVQRAGSMVMPEFPHEDAWTALTVLGGTLIVVQGFETTRYLGAEFDADTRIRACRLSQLTSTVVYLAFIALATPLMHFLGESVADNALIMLAGKASVLLPVPLVIAAVLSQFSAAVADTLGGGGNLAETTHDHVDERHAYLLICGIAVALAAFDTLAILALASRAFAFYYTLQCLVALPFARNATERAGFMLVAAALFFITLFAVPAG